MMRKMLFFVVLLAGINGMAQTVERYVSTNGTHQWPFTNWVAAATNLKTAVDWANTNNAGDTVWVSNGVHVLTAEVIVSNVIVRGRNDQKEEVIINGSSNRCFRLNHSNAKLQALTVSNGYSTSDTYRGGGVNLFTGQVVDAVIGWSYSYYAGGGIYFNGPGLVTGCLITANTARIGGGGIMMSSACAMSTVSCSQISGNITTSTVSGYGGGGICIQRGMVEGCLIASNRNSYNNGGGLCFYNGGGTVRDSTIISNRVDTYGGGGIGSVGSPTNVIVYGCVIRANTGLNGGGILYKGSGQTGFFWNCIIESNVASSVNGYGGGVFASELCVISNSVLRGNKGTHGSGAWLQGGAIFRSCLIMDNTQRLANMFGGGLYLQNTSLVENCTIVGNTAEYGGGIRMATSNGVIIHNCIVDDNWTGNAVRQDITFASEYAGGTSCFYYSCAVTTVLPPAQGNITNNPLFIAADDYRLQSGSPCINTGTNIGWMTGAFDLDSRPRQDRFSGKVDMGAYEFVPEGMLFMGK